MNIYRLFSPGVRICHWVIALSILVLFVTGLYIGDPGFIGTQGKEPVAAVAHFFSMENIRYLHFMTAAIFCTCLIIRAYLLVTYRGNRLFPNFFTRNYYKGIGEIVAYYSMLRSEHRPYLRNPLAATAYVTAYIFMVLAAITGLAMYSMINPNSMLAGVFGPINLLLGNEYNTHMVHHYIAWFFVLFFFVHVYMVVLNDTTEKNGELSSMLSGYKFFTQCPVDGKSQLVVKSGCKPPGE